MPTLASLPVELHYEILSYLPLRDQVLASMALPCWTAILSSNQRFQHARYTTPLGSRKGGVHSLIECADNRILCMMRIGQDGIDPLSFFLIVQQGDGQVAKYDISACPFLDEPWFLPPSTTIEPGGGGGGGGGSEIAGMAPVTGKYGARGEAGEMLRLRIGAVVCEPLWRGFFWAGDRLIHDSSMTVRGLVEIIARNLEQEIKSSALLKTLARGVHPVQFRPMARLQDRRQDVYMNGNFVLDTRRNFADHSHRTPSRRKSFFVS
ncbi:hypothetical protein DRE_00181 [Drechslerella stenobrocha 248]|uniref:F-box domain-containing protein n=1 Tax=Drechslerella stenobrocha 248 TaxID=1043628 RepID=W7HXE4_9PEZI|nr:hypothetical protein DRE_00181 [Drechslerella stenobrocha 248]